MSKKERDIWDDAIRSKLEDFEMDTLPGDWEAIADRLPGKAPVPLRRTLRYWVAAAVISLLVVSGGIYLYDREMEDLPIAQEIQSSQESTSVDTPVVLDAAHVYTAGRENDGASTRISDYSCCCGREGKSGIWSG